MESSLCQHLKNLLIDQGIARQNVEIRYDRARLKKNDIVKQIADLKNQIQSARRKSLASGGLARLGPVGAAAAALSKLESEVRLSRLEGELAQLEPRLPRIEAEAGSLASELNNLTENRKTTRKQLHKEGCT